MMPTKPLTRRALEGLGMFEGLAGIKYDSEWFVLHCIIYCVSALSLHIKSTDSRIITLPIS